jgi:hypothetical protein
MPAASNLTLANGIVLAVAVGLTGCGKMKQNDPRETAKLQAQVKRQQAACASPAAYDRLKALLFDKAIGARSGDRENLDILADYSLARMEEPVVKGWDPALDITRCQGRFILDIPPGAERGFGGERRLEADVDYTAQAAANGNGFVYEIKGAERVVAELAAFDLAGQAYRPPPAIDEPASGTTQEQHTRLAEREAAPVATDVPTRSAPVIAQRSVPSAPERPSVSQAVSRQSAPAEAERVSNSPDGDAGEATVRAFYRALGTGNGGAASSHIVPEKQSSRAFSSAAISRFYGRLPEPIRLTSVAPVGGGAYRVTYRYSAGRSHCNGSAIVRVTQRGGRDLIRSIRALNGC